MQLTADLLNTVIALGGSHWLLAVDLHNVGRGQAWWSAPREDARPVRVPWIIQDAFPNYHGVAWYWRDFSAPAYAPGQARALLRFEAVDYACEVWLNGLPVGGHEGAEGPFELDVTSAMGAGQNRLAVRVLNPSHEAIDGITLGETPHRCKSIPFVAGAAFNHGGITGPVHLILAPPTRVQDLWLRPDASSGIIRVQASLRSDLEQSARATVTFSVAPAPGGSTLCHKYLQRDLAPGDNVIEAELQVDSPLLWQLNEPNLYRVSARLQVESEGRSWADESSARCGFRDFCFERGYFRLNGRRLFLRGTHTLNHTPVGLQVPHDPDLLRRDLLHLKVMGFNLVRFIWGGAVPYQLDLCDEIGLLVYDESYAAFPFAESPHMSERFDRSISEVVRRDRNHPSVVIWGLLNEVHDNSLFRHAAASLPLLHELDGTRMAALNSGRWDKDMSLGSFSNPGSLAWDVLLGREGEPTPTLDGVAPVITPPSPVAHGDDIAHGQEEGNAALLGVEPAMDDSAEAQEAAQVLAAPASNLSHGHEAQHAEASEPSGPSSEDDGFGTDWATIPGYVMDMGDVHPYPRVPQLPVATEILRRLGHNSRRVYLSEYGIGSAVDLWRVTRHYERLQATHAEDAAFYRDKLDRFLHDWEQWKLGEAFVSPPEFFAASLAKMAGQRTLGLNAIRSNPNLAGYSLTGAIDHVMCGEGLSTLFRELKPGTVDALAEGFAPLRLCLFAEPPHIYRHSTLRLEAVLANEDALPAGDYRVQLQVVGPNMERVFQRTVPVTIPESVGEEEAPLAIPFFDEQVLVGGPSGKYRFVAHLEEGGAATGGEFGFFVTDAHEMPAVEGEVTLWGEDAPLSRWLAEHGIHARPFDAGEEMEARQVLVVGRVAQAGGAEAWRELARRIARGATVIFLSPQVFARGEEALFWLPLQSKGEPTSIRGWLYLKDEWAKRHPIFEGLPSGGLLDYAFYREVIPDALFCGQDAPLEAVAGAIKASQDYASGLMLAVHELGAGRFVLNTMRIVENLSAHPAAERLLRNLLLYAARDSRLPLAALPADFGEQLKEMGFDG